MADPFLGQQIGVGLIRNRTAAQWTAENPTLPLSVIGIESDTGKQKIGDNSTAWTSLGYSGGGQVGATLTTTPVSTSVLTEFGDGRDITVVCTLTDFVVGAMAGAAAALAVGNIICVLPAGAQFITVAYKSISLKCAGTAVAVDLGVGSLIGSGANAVLSGVGATAEDYLTGVATTTSSTGGTAVAQMVGVTAAIATNIAGSVKNIYLNGAATWNANNTGNLTAVGSVSIKYTLMS